MLPVLCRCCGLVIAKSALENPNICAACALVERGDKGPLSARGQVERSSPGTRQLDHFLELDGPSVVECVDALEQAKGAIAEAAALEEAAPAPPGGAEWHSAQVSGL